jgi:hypothetical protein
MVSGVCFRMGAKHRLRERGLEKYRSWVRLKWWRMRSPEGCTQIEEERARQKNNTRRSFNFNSSDYGVGSGVPTQGNVGRAKEGDWCGITRLEGRGVRNGVAEIHSQTSDGGSVWSL